MGGRERILQAGFILLALAVPAFGQVYYTHLAAEIAILGIAAISVDLLLGYTGLITFGHAAFFGIGAYVTGMLTLAGLSSALVVWPLAVLASMAAAALVGALALRTNGFPFIMVTLAFGQMIYYFFQSFRRYGGENGFNIPHRNTLGGLINLENQTAFYYVTLVLLVLVAALALRIVRSQFGMVIRGARDNERRLAAIGFPPYRYKLVAFVISGGIAGLAGALIANDTGQIGTDLLSWQQSGDLLAMVILGSAGTIIGPVFGAAVFLFCQQFLSGLTEHWMLYFGPLLVARVLFMREGLWEVLAGLVRRRGVPARPVVAEELAPRAGDAGNGS